MTPGRLIVLALLLFAGVSACVPAAPNPVDATADALGQSLAETATAEEPADPDSRRETAEAAATARGDSAAATEASILAQSADAQAATATAEAPYRGQLAAYGVDLTQGSFGWIHPPLQIYVEGYKEYDYANQFFGTTAEDFVVSADITWNTKYGTAGCGFVLRSDGDEESLDQYMVVATRFGDGRVIFNIMLDGEIFDARDLYAFGLDPEFEWRNDTTNRIAVQARGDVFSIFTNGTKIGEIDVTEPPPPPPLPPEPEEPDDDADPEAQEAYEEAKQEYDATVSRLYTEYDRRVAVYEAGGTRLPRGFVAMVAVNESGYTDCQFDDAWLFLLDE